MHSMSDPTMKMTGLLLRQINNIHILCKHEVAIKLLKTNRFAVNKFHNEMSRFRDKNVRDCSGKSGSIVSLRKTGTYQCFFSF